MPDSVKQTNNVDMRWHGLSFLANLFAREAKPCRPPETFTPQRTEFIGEQTGPVEDEIKARFCEVFDEVLTVQSAYLARLEYDDQPGHSVSLCIRSTSGIDASLQKRLGEVFAAMFKSSEHLDILFLRADQEQQLKKVCRPFYETG
jgi:hypothetical protein